MCQQNKYYQSLKNCEHICVFMRNYFGIKVRTRSRSKYHLNDMPIIFEAKGLKPPVAVSFKLASKEDSNDKFIYVRDDYKNIGCYLNLYYLDREALLHELQLISAEELANRRRSTLLQNRCDFDPVTGEIKTFEELGIKEETDITFKNKVKTKKL